MSLRREEFGEEVAASEYLFRFVDGSERAVKARVGRPYQDGSEVWACPVELVGFEHRYPDIRGSDSMQALELALSVVWSRLQDFIEKGGTVCDREGNPYTLNELRRIVGR